MISDKALFTYFIVILLALFIWLISWSAEQREIEFESRNCQPTNYYTETRGGTLTPVYECDE